jgi:SAM-dependent methyltransferase
MKIFRHCGYYYGLKEDALRTEALSHANGRDALELGSNTWRRWLERAHIRPASVHCINISEKEIAKGKTLTRDSQWLPEFHLMDAHKLEFDDSSFDVVFGSAILHHLNLTTALDEVRRVLRPSGVIVFKEPLDMNPLGILVRRLTPNARTVDEKPFRLRQISEIRSRFDCDIYTSQFLSVPAGVLSGLLFPTPRNPITYLAYKADRLAQMVFPPIGYFYREILIIGRVRNI